MGNTDDCPAQVRFLPSRPSGSRVVVARINTMKRWFDSIYPDRSGYRITVVRPPCLYSSHLVIRLEELAERPYSATVHQS